MMKQWQFTKSGHPRDVLHLADVPIPTSCADNELLIKVHYVSMNSAIAYKQIAHYGWMDPVASFSHSPCVPEMDFSGVVCPLVGSLSSSFFKPGDRVAGISPPWFMDLSHGVLREYVVVKYDQLFLVAPSIPLREACCFGATGITSYYSMMERVVVKRGDRVMITGASGGVGVMAVQLARERVGKEGKVVVSCGEDKIERIVALGCADEIMDYKKKPLAEQLKERYGDEPFDFIFDTVGADASLFNNSPHYLKPDGVFYAIGIDIGDTFGSLWKKVGETLACFFLPVFLGGVPRKFICESTKPGKERLERVRELMEERKIKAVIDSVFKFEEVIQAYEKQMSHTVVGKVVVEVLAE